MPSSSESSSVAGSPAQAEFKPRGKRGGRTPVDQQELGRLFDKLPPHSLEAEMALLGSLILDPNGVMDVLSMVSSADQFYAAAHGRIFQTIVRVYDEHRSGDLVQLVDALRGAGVLEEVGGEEFLVRLADTVPSAANAVHYARIVADKARVRRLVRAAGEIVYDAYHAGELESEGVRELLDRAESAIFEVAQEDQTSDPQLLKHLLDLEIDRLEAIEGQGISGLPTGFDDLDKKLRGLQEGEMIIVAARPSMGKTALALNLAEQVALGGRTPGDRSGGAKVPVAIFSLEMSKGALVQRLLSARSGVEGTKFRDGSLRDDDFQRVLAACNELSDAQLFIDDTPGLTVMQLRARARRLAAQHGVRAIMIDYLQLLTAPGAGRESRQVEVSAISRQVKALARELRVPIVCLSQLNRASEQREGNRPRMSDLRESGSIEQDADVVILLHREEYYHIGTPTWAEENPDKVGVAELIIAKQRNGPTGTVRLTWDSRTTRFKNHAPDDWGNDEFDAGGGPVSPGGGFGGPGSGGATGGYGGAFTPGRASGPVSGFRDGGGPDREDTGGAPF
ncbi:MAG: replicative DNA helicase [Phycisphaerales bacterium JB037]